jgi:hypothetical protein
MRSRAKRAWKHAKSNGSHPEGRSERAREARPPCEIVLPSNGIF